jgi:hypothetical protein
MKALYSNVLTSLALTATMSFVACHEADNGPSNAKTNAEFGTTTSALTTIPVQVAPAAGTDQPQLPTFDFTVDSNATNVQLAIRELVTGLNTTQNVDLTRAQANCVEPDQNCSYTLGTDINGVGENPLPGGAARWWVIGFDSNDSTTSGWSPGISFTVEASLVPTLVRPINGVDTAFNPPDLVWNSIGSSFAYNVYVADSDPSVFTRDMLITYTPGQVGCDTGQLECTLTSAQFAADFFAETGNAVLANGQVRWFVQASNGNWSAAGFFDVVAECFDDDNGTACDDNNLCSTGTCVRDQITDPVGSCNFADNTNACNDGNACTTGDICNDGTCRATDQNACTVTSVGALPSGATSPNDNFQWTDIAGVGTYRIFVRPFGQTNAVFDFTDTQANLCAGGTCTWEPGLLPNGEYQWFVQTPPHTGGCCTPIGNQLVWHGPWMPGVRYNVGYEQPVALTPISDETIVDTTPALSWSPINGTGHTYEIYVRDAGGTNRQYSVTENTAGCPAGTGTCNFSVTDILPGGWTQWWVQANDSGLWSAHSSFCVSGAACSILF